MGGERLAYGVLLGKNVREKNHLEDLSENWGVGNIRNDIQEVEWEHERD